MSKNERFDTERWSLMDAADVSWMTSIIPMTTNMKFDRIEDIETNDNNLLNRSEFVNRKWISLERRSSCCLSSQRPATNVLVVAAVLLLNPFKFSPQHQGQDQHQELRCSFMEMNELDLTF